MIRTLDRIMEWLPVILMAVLAAALAVTAAAGLYCAVELGRRYADFEANTYAKFAFLVMAAGSVSAATASVAVTRRVIAEVRAALE